MTIAAPRLVDGGGLTWWYSVRIPPGRTGNMVCFYVGLVCLTLAWLGLGRRLTRQPGARPAELCATAVLWGLPLVIGPALFSGDMYSYLAQGDILHLGLDPYRDTPLVLAHLGQRHVLDAVSPFWRGTTAPYGPLFLALVSVVVGVTGSHLVVGIVAVRLLEVCGVVLIAVFVPRLARTLGADPCRATWLAVASPLVLLQLVAAGHNDALMAGLMVAGVTLVRERRPLLGAALCAIAATVKVPAAAALLFVAVAWARDLPTRRARLRFSVEAAAVVAAVVGAVSAATGLGLGWISTTLLSTPGKVHLAVTPVTALGWTAARLLQGVGVTVGAHRLESAFGVVALVVTALLALVLLWRVRFDDMTLYAGIVLFAAALGGPAAWPWYFCWGLVLIAAWPGAQSSGALALAVAASVLLVKPDGILALPLATSPATVAFYVALAVLVALRWRDREGRRRPGRAEDRDDAAALSSA
ncbi:MAG: hypothetical protein JWO62_2086 [Acidimicrobiaceae bacterium]|nr:hypothetical protein [Acidimicrobiaceae bacterium]